MNIISNLYRIIVVILFVNSVSVLAKDGFKTNLYLENYYNHPLFETQNNNMPHFLVSYQRANEIAPNLILLRSQYDNELFKANFGLMSGTYTQLNMSNEPEIMRMIYEANFALKPIKDFNLWIEAGIFESRIGMESPIGQRHPTLSRSIVAENIPYYESGAKLSYLTDDNSWLFSIMAINGWQTIQRDYHQSSIAIGHQLTYNLDSVLKLNSSSFVGDVSTIWQEANMRYFHNFYIIYHTPFDFSIYASFDIGSSIAQFREHQGERKTWYATTFIGKYKFTENLSLSARYENFEDPYGLINTQGSELNFKASGYSFNIDYSFDKISGLIDPMIRLEYRNFNSNDLIYATARNKYYNVNLLTLSLIANIDFH